MTEVESWVQANFSSPTTTMLSALRFGRWRDVHADLADPGVCVGS
ncbi:MULTISPECIES: hypothetical protein [Streptomyces]